MAAHDVAGEVLIVRRRAEAAERSKLREGAGARRLPRIASLEVELATSEPVVSIGSDPHRSGDQSGSVEPVLSTLLADGSDGSDG